MNLTYRRPAVASNDGAAPADGAVPDGTARPSSRRSTHPRQGLLSRIGGTVLTIVMAITLIIFVAMTVLRISGGELLAIRTGSMAPMMEPGDLLISRDVDPRTIRRGDVVTFRVPSADNTLVTHRVTKVTDDGNSFTTKGDANDTVDPFTTAAEDVLGIRWFSIPSVGRIMVFLSSGLGTALLIGIPGAIYLGQTLADRRAVRRALDATTTAAATSTAPAAAAVEEVPAAPADSTPIDEPHARPEPHDRTESTPGPPEPATSRPEPIPPLQQPTPQWCGTAPHAGHRCAPAACAATQVATPQVIVVQVPPMAAVQMAAAPTFVPAPPVPPAPVVPPPYVPVATTPPTPWPPLSSQPPLTVSAEQLPPDVSARLGSDWAVLVPVAATGRPHPARQPHPTHQPLRSH